MIMKKKTYEGYTYVDGGVCAAKGFVANGINCGLNSDKNKNDLGMVYSSTVCNAAAVYTQNKVKGAPILVTKEHLKATGGKAMAVVVNSKNANTCNADGVEKAERICELAADALGIDADMIINASTGVIGQIIPIEPFEAEPLSLAAAISLGVWISMKLRSSRNLRMALTKQLCALNISWFSSVRRSIQR